MKRRRISAIALVVLGGALIFLAPEQTVIGVVLMILGVVIETVGITLEHRG
jgi:drug/metabolite transporter (DMT)-like permease